MEEAVLKEEASDLEYRELENPLQAGDLCPDCGQWAVEIHDGLQVCLNCGEVVP